MPSFGRELFHGRLRVDLVDSPPGPGHRLDDESEEFLARLRAFCTEKVDSRSIERTARIPDEVIAGLKDLGAFAIKLPKEYGGLGLSGVCYHRALMIVGSTHSALGELLGAHQAIGLIQPLRLSGTPEQKAAFLPRCVREISGFIMTEPDIGNDPFRMHTTATPAGDSYVLNGVKLWTTNGVLADLLVVMAMAPGGMSAFVVPGDAPGVTVEQRNSFLGLRGLENGVIRFHDVAVPAFNRIGAEGAGLDVALGAQDTGRLSMPAVCAANAKWALKIAREWSRVRVQWGKPIGEHEAVASKIAFIAATAFALEAMVEVTGRHADAGADTGVDAELAKLFASEKAWAVADELLQIRGGRGYETAESAAARGERGVPVEQMFRDLRIGRIFDGSTEALRGFIADAALSGAAGADGDDGDDGNVAGSFGALAEHVQFAERSVQELGRHLSEARTRWGADFASRQLFVGRLVDIAAELYAMTVSCVYAKARSDVGTAGELAEVFCGQSRRRIAELFDRLYSNTDESDRVAAERVLADRYTWLEEGVLDPSIEGPWIAEPAPGPSRFPNLHRTVPT
jgi:alkylation response protein AidB-like acyl-CoA dehydrogenase